LLELLQNDVREMLCNHKKKKSKKKSVTFPHNLNPEGVWPVLEHLNIYARYYITAIEERLHLNQSGPNQNFTPGWLGNYFTNLMKPTEEE
jgi:hypothetical protein